MQTPSDCALLITIPLAEQDFLFDLHDSEKDFVKNWAENQRLASDEDLSDAALWKIYSPRVRDFVLKTAGEIESLGVKVIYNARLDDLREVFLTKKIVTLEAHWFSPKLEMEDFYSPNDFVKNLCESEETAAKALRGTLFSDGSDLSEYSEKSDFAGLVRSMNKAFSGYNVRDRQPEPISIISDSGNVEEEIWIQLNRFALEKTFPGEVRNKCKIEMFDGLYPVEDLARKVPLNFDGVIDFTVCNSELAGKTLKQFRRDCLVITNRFVIDLRLRLILYKGAVNLLLNGICETYVDAVINLRKQLWETNRREK